MTESTATPGNIEVDMNDFVPSPKIPDIYPEIYNKSSWQWIVNTRKTNGLGPAFKKVGRRLFVNTKTLARCIDARGSV